MPVGKTAETPTMPDRPISDYERIAMQTIENHNRALGILSQLLPSAGISPAVKRSGLFLTALDIAETAGSIAEYLDNVLSIAGPLQD